MVCRSLCSNPRARAPAASTSRPPAPAPSLPARRAPTIDPPPAALHAAPLSSPPSCLVVTKEEALPPKMTVFGTKSEDFACVEAKSFCNRENVKVKSVQLSSMLLRGAQRGA